MKIGIDAKWLFKGPISGKLFIQNLLPELVALHPEIEWHVFLNRNDKSSATQWTKENLSYHYVRPAFNMLLNLFALPKQARHFRLDAVLFQTFSPKSKYFKSIVFIHDILFRSHPRFFTLK